MFKFQNVFLNLLFDFANVFFRFAVNKFKRIILWQEL